MHRRLRATTGVEGDALRRAAVPLSPAARGRPMSARHRAEDAGQASRMELLDPDPQRSPTVLVELSFPPPGATGDSPSGGSPTSNRVRDLRRVRREQPREGHDARLQASLEEWRPRLVTATGGLTVSSTRLR